MLMGTMFNPGQSLLSTMLTWEHQLLVVQAQMVAPSTCRSAVLYFPCTVACASISATLPSPLMLLILEGLTAGEYVEEECERPLLMSRLHAAHL